MYGGVPGVSGNRHPGTRATAIQAGDQGSHATKEGRVQKGRATKVKGQVS